MGRKRQSGDNEIQNKHSKKEVGTYTSGSFDDKYLVSTKSTPYLDQLVKITIHYPMLPQDKIDTLFNTLQKKTFDMLFWLNDNSSFITWYSMYFMSDLVLKGACNKSVFRKRTKKVYTDSNWLFIKYAYLVAKYNNLPINFIIKTELNRSSVMEYLNIFYSFLNKYIELSKKEDKLYKELQESIILSVDIFKISQEKSIFLKKELDIFFTEINNIKDTLAKPFLRKVIKEIRKYNQDDMMELFQVGCSGLMTAIDKFDETETYAFPPYAEIWIRQAVLAHFKNSCIIKPPTTLWTTINNIDDILDAPVLLEGDPENNYIKDSIITTISLDAHNRMIEEEETDPLSNIISNKETPEDVFLMKEAREQIEKYLQFLTDEEKIAVLRSFDISPTCKNSSEVYTQHSLCVTLAKICGKIV